VGLGKRKLNSSSRIRCHRLLKTFYAGWRDRRLPDGTVAWTSPAGRTYTTHPGSRLLLPHWNTATAELPAPAEGTTPAPWRGLAMTRRKRTRAQTRAQRINTEREQNRKARGDKVDESPLRVNVVEWCGDSQK
jgi:hypothetical protein